MTLDDLPAGHAAEVAEVKPPGETPEWGRWLEDLGFVPGESVAVLARSRFGGDPLVVRVGHSTFALRRAEAACIRVGSKPAR